MEAEAPSMSDAPHTRISADALTASSTRAATKKMNGRASLFILCGCGFECLLVPAWALKALPSSLKEL